MNHRYACPSVLHVVESWRPVPSGYVNRSWWIIEGQARLSLSRPTVLVTSRHCMYSADDVVEPANVSVRLVCESASERRIRWHLPALIARPFHVDRRHLRDAIIEAARSCEAELIHCHWSSSIGMAAAAASKRLGIPLVAEVRFDLAGAVNTQSLGNRARVLETPLRRWFERHLKQASAVVAASQGVANLLAEQFPLLQPPPAVVPNGIDVRFVEAAERARCDRLVRGSSRRLAIGTTSKMLRYENLQALLDLVVALPGIDLLFIGDGPDKSGLERAAAQLSPDVQARIRFTGRVPAGDIPVLLAQLDVFVMPRIDSTVTRHASPLKIVEAMAAGLPIVATATGDTATLLADGRGSLVPPGDQAVLQQAVRKLLDDEAGRAQMGSKARAYAADTLNGDRLLMKYREIYRNSFDAVSNQTGVMNPSITEQ